MSDGRSARRDAAEKVYGIAAATAVLTHRSRDVMTIAYTSQARRPLAGLLKLAARERISYREVPAEELDRIAGTIHHEGVCLRARPAPPQNLRTIKLALSKGGYLIALDQIGNPNNVGAIVRSAAFFGARGVLVGGPAKALTPSAVRTAEGGAELVPVAHVQDLAEALKAFQAEGVDVVGTDAHDGVPLTRFRFSERSVLVLGSERAGLSPHVSACCTRRVRIAGASQLDSLNVSVAAGVVMAYAFGAESKRP